MDLVSAYTLNSMFWGMYITLELITKQIIYCVKGDILKMLTIYIQLYFMAVLIVKYLFLLNQNTRCL